MRSPVLSFNEFSKQEAALAGGKGSSLVRLAAAGFPVPDGFIILPGAFQAEQLTESAWKLVRQKLAALRGDQDIAFVVRSSAMSEDSAEASFAGEFESVLNVRSDEAIYQAVHTVYRSRQNERVQAYSRVKGIDEAHEIAVIIQRLVPADCSGVLFTANPISGQRDQAMISAAWGLGEAIVGGIVSPDTLIVEKASGRVLQRQTADKQVMTVRLAEGTEEQRVSNAKRLAPVLSDGQAAELVQIGNRIEALYGRPMDIEWTLQGETLAIVQARPITALPEPEPAPPSQWKLGKGQYSAMRNNIVELMADPLSPLFGSLGRAAVNRGMRRLLNDFMGRDDIMPAEPIILVNEYAYYNGSLSAKSIGLIMWHSVGILRRMFAQPVAQWLEKGRPAYVATVADWQTRSWQAWPAQELVAGASTLTEAAVAAYGSLVSGVIPAAWMSEALFTLVYKLFCRRKGDPEAPTYLMGFDSLPYQAEKALYDLAQWVSGQAELADFLLDTPTPQLVAQLKQAKPPTEVEPAAWQSWQQRFQTHLEAYGHTIYNLDFANPVPADDPVPLLDTCKLFISGQGVNPHQRQQAAARRREEATAMMLGRLKGLRRRWFRWSLGLAQRFAPLREDGLADVGLSYPLLRQMLREVGQRMVEAGALGQADDIYWLIQEEVERAAARLDQGRPLDDLSSLVPRRQAVWRAAQKASPPRALPQFKIPGLDLARWKQDKADRKQGLALKGVAASPGQVTGRARVISGPQDFGQMQTGEVLVAALTTPAWTPLFARAAAIVTDIGGPLSHGSIVAREYGIPAVLGTGAATARIRNGQQITVDGSRGRVILSSNGG